MKNLVLLLPIFQLSLYQHITLLCCKTYSFIKVIVRHFFLDIALIIYMN